MTKISHNSAKSKASHELEIFVKKISLWQVGKSNIFFRTKNYHLVLLLRLCNEISQKLETILSKLQNNGLKIFFIYISRLKFFDLLFLQFLKVCVFFPNENNRTQIKNEYFEIELNLLCIGPKLNANFFLCSSFQNLWENLWR